MRKHQFYRREFFPFYTILYIYCMVSFSRIIVFTMGIKSLGKMYVAFSVVMISTIFIIHISNISYILQC